MKKMGAVGLLVFLLVVSILIPALVSDLASSTDSADSHNSHSVSDPAYQYDPSIVYQEGVVFDRLSSVISTDSWVRDFTIGDFNDDGLKDVAVISNKTNVISIYNRTSDGSLSPHAWQISKPGVVDMRDIAAGDLNKTGMDDIVVSYNDSSGSAYICIFHQSYNYSSSEARTKPLSASEPFELTIGKFNNSVDNCIATVCRGNPSYGFDDYVDIWRYPFGLPSNDRRSHQIAASPHFFKSRFISSGDIDGDDKDDLVVGNDSGPNVYIMIQPMTWVGSWTTSTKPISGQASDIELADMWGLGHNDLIFADSTDSGGNSWVYVYNNTHTSQLFGPDDQAPAPIKTFLGLGSVALGEISGGPGIDLVTLSKTSNNASTYFRDVISSWYGSVPNLTFPTGIVPTKAIVDRSMSGAGCVFVLSQGLPNGAGSLESFRIGSVISGNANSCLFIPTKDPASIAASRLPNGNVVVATTLYLSNQLLIYEKNASSIRVLSTQSGPVDVAFGDFDSDSSADIAVINSVNHSVSIYLGSQLSASDQPFKNITFPFLNPESIALESLRGTGPDDIVVGYDGGVFILYNTGDSQLFRPDLNETLGIGLTGLRSAICVGDLDSNNDEGDIAVLNEGTDAVEVYLRNMAGSIGSFYRDLPNANLTNSGSQFTAIAIGDFGGTPYPDVAVSDETNKVFFYRQPSYGFITNRPVPSETLATQDEVSVMASGDLNDDGLNDLLVSFTSLPGISGYFRSGDLVFKNAFNGTSGGPAGDILVWDVDGDARVDVGCASPHSHSMSLWFQQNLIPSANATASKYSEYEGVGIIFDGSESNDSYSDRSSLSYYWAFNSTDHASGISATHVFLTSGVYTVSLRVTDRGGLTNYSNITVTITDASPTASFTPPQSPLEGVEVDFTDTSTSYPDQIVNWTWEFGDGNKAYTKDATHTYMQSRDYTVNLTVVDDDGSDNVTRMNVEVGDVSPRADFTVSNLSPLENATVNFVDTSYSYPDTITLREWDFGDGNTSNLQNVSHVYDNNGSYNVTLIVTDSDGSKSTYWRIVQVQDSVPIASFEFSVTTPLEGQTVHFVDKSSAYDGVGSWHWDFGDGNTSDLQNPSHVYGDNGSYNVILLVYDGDLSTSQKMLPITVQDTSPTIISLTAQSGLTSFDEDESVTFTITTSLAWESIKRYEWNFSYSSSFVVDGTTLVSHTTHSFPQSGDHMVVVRVWDSDSYVEDSLWLDIVNVRPTAGFSSTSHGNGVMEFDAGHSTDTPHDKPLLMYMWNFDDGSEWQPWSSNKTILHSFSYTREYDITLEVMDDDRAIGTITERMTITGPDSVKPSVSGVVVPQDAVVGKPITVFANVTDDYDIESVVLHFRIGNKTGQTLMTRVSGTTYQGQIPSQNSSVTISCWIVAEDVNGNIWTTGNYQIIVQEVVPAEYWAAGFGGAAILLVGMFLGFRRYNATVDEAFIIYEDGRLIAHQTRHLKPGMDNDVLSSMLIAIQDFVKDSFKDERTTALKRLDFGEKKILVEKGERVYLAAVLHGKHAGKIPQKMLQVVEEIQRDFGPIFAQWDGNLEDVRGVKDETQSLFKTQWSVSRVIRLRRSEEGGPLMTECPVCNQSIPADSKRCPSCGADFGNATVADLEQVAQDLLQDSTVSPASSDQASHDPAKDESPRN